MSQSKFINSNGREVMFGLDKPTGGFYYTEFYNFNEIPEGAFDEVVCSEDGLTLSELVDKLEEKYNFPVNPQIMINYFETEQNPTGLQVNVGSMFGKNILQMLQNVEKDIEDWKTHATLRK